MENKTENQKRSNIFFAMEFSDVVFWIMKWKWIVVLVTVLFGILGYVFSQITYVPTYVAKASMVVNSKQSTFITNQDNTQAMISNDIYITSQMMGTYTSVLTSDRVGAYVIDKLGITNTTSSSIRSALKITSNEDSTVVYIEATYTDPYMAKNIANATMEIAPQLMTDVVEVGSVNILDYARLPSTPKASGTTQIIILAMILGLVASSAFIIFFNFVTMKIKNSEDIEFKTGISVFGEIPHLITTDGESKYLCESQSNQSYVESYFMMSAVLRNQSEEEKKPYKLIVTSSVAGEGKTTTAINTASALADMGYAVLLVDLDMKKFTIARQLNINVKDKKGVEGVITGTPIDEEILKTKFHFDILPCTSTVNNTSRLLSSVRLENFFTELDKTAYDYIIVDTAPAHIIADTSVIVKYADGLLMVIKQHYARLKIIMDTIETLKKSGANIIGSVLNDVRVYNVGTGYAYKYKYGYYGAGDYYAYHYGYGYGSDDSDVGPKKKHRHHKRSDKKTALKKKESKQKTSETSSDGTKNIKPDKNK